MYSVNMIIDIEM